MAITETRPDTGTPDPLVEHVNPWDTGEIYPSFARTIGSGDHKTLGRLYVGLSLLFGVAAWVLIGLSGAHGVPEDGLLPEDSVFQVYTSGRVSLVLLAVLPLLVGLATYVVPLQVGAATVAFPRAAAAALWTWLVGAVMTLAGYATNGGPGGGRANAVDLTFLGMAAAIVALLLATVCVLTTVVTLRTPGMTLDRVPLFAWSVFVGGSLWMLTLPALLANLTLVYLDHHYGLPSDFGLADDQWTQLTWAFGQPQVFAYAIPVLGIVGDVVTTMAGTRQRLRGLVLVGIGLLGVLSFGAYAQVFFNEEVREQALYVGVGVLVLLPLLLCFSAWSTTMSVRPRITGASIAALGAALGLLTGGVASALYVIAPLRLQETTAFADGVLVLVVGSAFLGGLAGVLFWAPKIWGRFANEGTATLAALAGTGGVFLGGLPLCVLGFATRFEALADADAVLLAVAALGALLLVGSTVLVAAAVLAARPGEVAADAWGGGQTLEWLAPSPPPPGNFGALPVVTSPEPLLDTTDTEEAA
jgi:heme/copper-type cytochrome/quinol oxidase subunit 1